MKTKVFNFFKNLPKSPVAQFNEAFKLYQDSPGFNFGQVRYLNAAGYSKPILENLLYDLKQLHNITDAQIRIAKRKDQPLPEVSPFTIPNFSKGGKGNLERKAFVKKNNIDTEGKYSNKVMDPLIKKWADDNTAKWNEEQIAKKMSEAGKKASDAAKGLSDSLQNLEVVYDEVEHKKNITETVKTLPEEAKEYISLHDQFPFLDEDDCPEELKILVADKRKHYLRWKEAHSKLLVMVPEKEGEAPTPISDEELYEILASAVENFEVNQAIYEELNHYNKEKEILGVHPIFAERKLKGVVDTMTMAAAAKRQSNLDSYIRKYGNKITEETDADKIVEWNKKIEDWKIELSLVNAKLGVSEK